MKPLFIETVSTICKSLSQVTEVNPFAWSLSLVLICFICCSFCTQFCYSSLSHSPILTQTHILLQFLHRDPFSLRHTYYSNSYTEIHYHSDTQTTPILTQRSFITQTHILLPDTDTYSTIRSSSYRGDPCLIN